MIDHSFEAFFDTMLYLSVIGIVAWGNPLAMTALIHYQRAYQSRLTSHGRWK